jgi:hypothetical protein
LPFNSSVFTARQADKPPRAATFFSTISAALKRAALPFVCMSEASMSGTQQSSPAAQDRNLLGIENLLFPS